MSLFECNTEELTGLRESNPEAVFYRVCRAPIFEKGVKNSFVLAPNKELHVNYQDHKITWEEYIPEYLTQIRTSEKAQILLSKIKEQAKEQDVYLVCVCGREKGERCHRFLLKRLIEGGV